MILKVARSRSHVDPDLPYYANRRRHARTQAASQVSASGALSSTEMWPAFETIDNSAAGQWALSHSPCAHGTILSFAPCMIRTGTRMASGRNRGARPAGDPVGTGVVGVQRPAVGQEDVSLGDHARQPMVHVRARALPLPPPAAHEALSRKRALGKSAREHFGTWRRLTRSELSSADRRTWEQRWPRQHSGPPLQTLNRVGQPPYG